MRLPMRHRAKVELSDDFAVVGFDEQLRDQMMHPVGLRKRKRLSHVAGQALTYRPEKPLHVSELATVFRRLLVRWIVLKHRPIGLPEVAEAPPLTVVLRNLCPEPRAGLSAAVADHEGHHLPSAPAQRDPQPALVRTPSYE